MVDKLSWTETRLKFIANTGSGTTPDSKTTEYYKNGNLNWIQSGDLYNRIFINNVSKKITELAAQECRLKYYSAPFVVVAMYGASIGNVSISLIDSYTNQACCVILPKVKTDIKFLYYAITVGKANLLVESIGGSQPNISQEKINNLKILLPPIEEQQQIVSYLDARCSKIDGAVAQRKAIIEKLKEYKSAVITKAVTKGLNPEAEMKDSGIEWIGQIPELATVSRMKFEANIILGKMVQPQQKTDDETLERYLCSANIKWEGVDTSVEKQMWFSDFEKELYRLQKGDILVTEGGSIGVSCVYNNEFVPCYFQNSVMCVRAIPSKSTSRFLYYWMHFAVSSGYVESVCNRATITHYPKMKLSNTPIISYPLDVQEAIVDYLDSQCAKIDEAIERQEQAVAKLEEYRKSIIYHAVTGKIDCRDI